NERRNLGIPRLQKNTQFQIKRRENPVRQKNEMAFPMPIQTIDRDPLPLRRIAVMTINDRTPSAYLRLRRQIKGINGARRSEGGYVQSSPIDDAVGNHGACNHGTSDWKKT